MAAPGDLTVDAKVTVSGFEAGDTVTAYQFITWVDGEGWKLADGITGITLADIEGKESLTKEQLATLASAANIAKMTAVTGTTSGTTWEYTCGTMATAGSYLILVADSKAEHIYNPAVVSADFDGTNIAAVDLTENAALIKKQSVTVEKTVDDAPDDYDVQVGDIVPFTVTVTVPQYNTNWTEPYFVVSDVLSLLGRFRHQLRAHGGNRANGDGLKRGHTHLTCGDTKWHIFVRPIRAKNSYLLGH